jgi:ERCC4-type nuclease
VGIRIDSREDIEAISQTIPLEYSNIFEVKKMDLGDFYITKPNGKTVIIERKSIADFCNSLHNKKSGNGSFESKLRRMSPLADRRALLVEGDWISGDDNRLYFQTRKGLETFITMSEFRNFIENRQNEGCQFYHTRTLKETIDTLITMHNNEGGNPPLKVDNWDNFGYLLPGIGKVKWQQIKKMYKNPKEAFQHIDEWPGLMMRWEW